jgi:YaaC-like Protein
MSIKNARKIRSADRELFAWAGLRKFHNVDVVADKLIEIHSIPARWHQDAKKQAQQLKYCLVQAREYFQAAQSVSLATRPNLLYYGTMSLALAEILFKQSGERSLDKARAEHRHHGLTVTVGGIGRYDELAAAASQLKATPVEINGHRRGTFELWHQSAREGSRIGSGRKKKAA